MTHSLYRNNDPRAQLMEFKCIELVEETFLGHLRKNQLVKRWEGETIVVNIERKVPPLDRLYQR
jgi:hypothetical protein